MFRNCNKNGIHESYYDHACRVINERDILEITFKDTTFISLLMRKWYDLFLLSYSDERAVYLYHSTHAMRMGRARHYQRHRGSIHPFSKFRNYWDMFMVYTVILHLILMYFNTTVILKSVPAITCYIAMLLEVFIILDIFINARTGFINRFSRVVELDNWLIFKNYSSQKLFFHAASAIPLSCIMFLRYGNTITCTICKANNFNCVISFLTLINLFRAYELSSYWDSNRMTIIPKIFSHFQRIAVNITLITIQIVYFSDTISTFHIMKTETWSSMSLYHKRWSFFDNYFYLIHIAQSNTSNIAFVNGQIFRVVNFLVQPHSGWMNKTYNDSFAVIYPHPLMKFVAYVILVLTTSWLVLEMFNYSTCKKYFHDEIYKSDGYISELVRVRQLPDELHSHMKYYAQFTATKIRILEITNGLFRSFPKSLKEEIAWQSCSRSILRISYFSDWPKEVVKKIVLLIEEHIFLENDVVVEAGVPGQGLMIVDAGLLAVYEVHSSQHKEVDHFIDGDYFGQLSLVTDREVSTYSVVALTDSKILFVEKVLFRHLMRSWPDLFYSLRKELESE